MVNLLITTGQFDGAMNTQRNPPGKYSPWQLNYRPRTRDFLGGRKERKKLAYQVTRAEGNALHFLALALRPEWAPRTKDGKGPGEIWQEEITNNTFPHAENFDHCLAALTDYCKAQKQGKPRWTHPRPFPGEGNHWKTTVPTTLEKNPRDPCPDHPLDRANKWSCIGCRSEILSGDRPWNMQGKPLAPEQRHIIPSPGILTEH